MFHHFGCVSWISSRFYRMTPLMTSVLTTCREFRGFSSSIFFEMKHLSEVSKPNDPKWHLVTGRLLVQLQNSGMHCHLKSEMPLDTENSTFSFNILIIIFSVFPIFHFYCVNLCHWSNFYLFRDRAGGGAGGTLAPSSLFLVDWITTVKPSLRLQPPLVSDHLSSETSLPTYQKFPCQITIFGTSCKRAPLVSDREHF